MITATLEIIEGNATTRFVVRGTSHRFVEGVASWFMQHDGVEITSKAVVNGAMDTQRCAKHNVYFVTGDTCSMCEG